MEFLLEAVENNTQQHNINQIAHEMASEIGLEQILNIISTNYTFFTTAVNSPNKVISWTTRNGKAEFRAVLKNFSDTLKEELTKAQDTRISISRDDPFDGFSSFVRLSNKNPDHLKSFLKTNKNVQEFLNKNLNSLAQIINEWNANKTRKKYLSELLPHKQENNNPAEISIISFMLQHKYFFIANVIGFVAQTTKNLNTAYQNWLTLNDNSSKIEKNISPEKTTLDPFRYSLTKLLFISSKIFHKITTVDRKKENKDIAETDENIALEFIKSILYLSNKNIGPLKKVLTEYNDIPQFLKNKLPTISQAVNPAYKITIIDNVDYEDEIDDSFEGLFNNETKDLQILLTTSLIKRYPQFIFYVTFSNTTFHRFIESETCNKKQAFLIKLQHKYNAFREVYNNSSSRDRIDNFITTFKNAGASKPTNFQLNLARTFTMCVTTLLLDKNEQPLQNLLKGDGYELAKLLAKFSKHLEEKFFYWEYFFSKHYPLSEIHLKSFETPEPNLSIKQGNNNNYSSDEETPLSQGEHTSSYSTAQLVTQNRTTMEEANNADKKRKSPYESHNIESHLNQLTSHIMHEDDNSPALKIARTTPSNSSFTSQ